MLIPVLCLCFIIFVGVAGQLTICVLPCEVCARPGRLTSILGVGRLQTKMPKPLTKGKYFDFTGTCDTE